MTEFDENDVTIEHAKLVDRSGYLRLTHRPSGLFVDAELKSQPVLKTMQELMGLLRRRVLAWQAQDDASEAERPAVPAGGRT
jgi:hypothetical protein